MNRIWARSNALMEALLFRSLSITLHSKIQERKKYPFTMLDLRLYTQTLTIGRVHTCGYNVERVGLLCQHQEGI